MMNEELEIKTARIVEMLTSEGFDGVLMTAQHNFAWASCGGNNGVDQSRENGVANLLFAADGRRYLAANNIEMRRVRDEQLPTGAFETIEYSWQDEKSSGDLAIQKARRVAGKNIATDIQLHPSAAAIESKISALRFSLTGQEKLRYRALGSDAGSALRKTFDKIKPGETEIQIAAAMKNELAKVNATAVVSLVAADERIAKFRHPVPTEKRWERVLMLITCAKRGGLIVNLTRIVCVGDVQAELDEKTHAAAFVNARLWSATKAGARSDDLYFVAADAYEEAGFGHEIDLHHQGGATGYRTRDWVANPSGKDVVVHGQAFAWNPSITGTKIEETVLLNNDGIEVITVSPDFPIISHTIDGIEFSATGVLSV